jgi:hypothetical protein
MLEELRNLKYSPTKEGIVYFLTNIVNNNKYDASALNILCSHAPGRYQLSASYMLSYCLAFDWVLYEEGEYFLSEEIAKNINDKKKLNSKLIENSVRVLFDVHLFNPGMFVYDADSNRIRFRNELFPLEYSAIRNTLISQGLFEVDRRFQRTFFYLMEEYTNIIGIHIKKQKKRISLEQLKKKLEKNAAIGELAEQFVLEFERKRLPADMRDKIRIISSIDVTAGYDIVSYETETSTEIDRFIEVKAVNREMEFYWSENEYEIARLKGTRYYLYLVDLTSIDQENYKPMMICNPANSVIESECWLIETQTYHVRYVPN